MSQDNALTPAQLAAQLRRPHGEQAIEVAGNMNRANGALTRRSITLLSPGAGDRVLEIGPGNAAFAPELVGAAPGVHYTGLDLSDEMVAEAVRLNARLIDAGQARFLAGDSAALPFADASFERVLSVNTLHFWEPAADHLREIRRVTTQGGVLCLAFGEKRFMRALPFAGHGFTLYDQADACALLENSGWHVLDTTPHEETLAGNNGQVVHRQMLIVRASPQR